VPGKRATPQGEEVAVDNALYLLKQISETQGIPVLLIGAYALQAYGVIRQTLDVDVLISEADVSAADAGLRRAGYTEVVRSEIFTRYRHSSTELADVDVLYVDSETAKRMVGEAREYSLAETTCLVPTLPHLLALKLHAIRSDPRRESRDFADIIELVRANPEGIGKDELNGLCVRYGPKGIWEKVKGALWNIP
jgi:hypothetical protein